MAARYTVPGMVITTVSSGLSGCSHTTGRSGTGAIRASRRGHRSFANSSGTRLSW